MCSTYYDNSVCACDDLVAVGVRCYGRGKKTLQECVEEDFRAIELKLMMKMIMPHRGMQSLRNSSTLPRASTSNRDVRRTVDDKT